MFSKLWYAQARTLLKSLVIIGAILGLVLGTIGTSVPWLFPNIFTHDQSVIQEVSLSFLNFNASLFSFCTTCHHVNINTASLVRQESKYLF